MTIIRTTALTTSLVVFSAIAAAQVPAPSCSAPAKPAAMETQEQVTAWARKVEGYQKCLMSFSAKHKKLSDQHAAAANKAVETWNGFVKTMNENSKSW